MKENNLIDGNNQTPTPNEHLPTKNIVDTLGGNLLNMNNVDELEPLVRQAPLSLVYEPETNKFSITQNNKIVYIYNKLINPKLETLLQQEGNINIHFKNGECHFDFIGDFFDDYGDVSFGRKTLKEGFSFLLKGIENYY